MKFDSEIIKENIQNGLVGSNKKKTINESGMSNAQQQFLKALEVFKNRVTYMAKSSEDMMSKTNAWIQHRDNKAGVSDDSLTKTIQDILIEWIDQNKTGFDAASNDFIRSIRSINKR